MSLKKAVFLDFDGTLVKDLGGRGPRTIEEIEILPGVVDGCKRLVAAGYELVVVTNQPDIERGIVSEDFVVKVIGAALDEIGIYMSSYVCNHISETNCSCRKPCPGMLYTAAFELELSLKDSWLIGDSDADHLSALAAGVNDARVHTNEGIKRVVDYILSIRK